MRWPNGRFNCFIGSFQGDDPYSWPMFSSLPVPRCYTLDPPKILQSSQGKRNREEAADIIWCIIVISYLWFSRLTDSEISTFLASSKDSKNEESWMETCRRLYCKVMTSKPNILTGKGERLVLLGSCGFSSQ